MEGAKELEQIYGDGDTDHATDQNKWIGQTSQKQMIPVHTDNNDLKPNKKKENGIENLVNQLQERVKPFLSTLRHGKISGWSIFRQ